MRDIAARTGVSPMSVSRALSGGPGVSEKTRKLVLATAEDFGYQPNEFARQLRTGGPAHVIACVLTHLANPFYAAFALGVERAAARRGWRVMILSTTGDPGVERDVVSDLRTRHVDGVVVVPATPDHRHFAQLIDSGRPLVFATTPPNGIDADSVIIDDFGGMHALTTSLLSDGHRKIGLLGLDRAMWTGSERLRGYAAAHAERSVPVDRGLITEHAGDVAWANRATRQLLTRADPPTAIIAANNRMTVGALRAIRDAGARTVLAGFDDIEVADLFHHALTVVTFDAEEIGDRSATLLFDRLTSPDGRGGPVRKLVAPIREVLPTGLVRYGSVSGQRR